MTVVQAVPADFFQRASALVMDVIIQFVCAYIAIPIIFNLIFPASTFRGVVIGVGLLITFFFYEPIMVTWRGQTFGHQFFKIKVTRVDGGHVGFLPAIVRFWLKWFLGLLSFFTMLGEKRQAFHDHMTRSMVIKV